ncbi:type II toxin-antitoxin system VapC family toxin [Nocardia sp. NPDC052566]|uniref:type II toxin-antitoxin system VapC family toxin n=1 Tax=Nocardia sp. NPDC052566 TaxID=3364330 RepID=UPI0037C59424
MTTPAPWQSGYLLDTTTISEWTTPRPNLGLMEWLHTADEEQLFLSVITIGEMRRGVERLPDGRRKTRLTEWLADQVVDRFGDRLLEVDLDIVQAWGRVRDRADALGQPVDPVDGLIAATADAHGLAVVTRDPGGFVATGVPTICPWSE